MNTNRVHFFRPLCYLLILTTFGIVSNQKLVAQDAVFSQFYALPMSLNPSLAGTYDGKYRIGAIYRDQYRSMLDEPFITYGFGLDLKFDVDPKGISKDFFSAGIYFQTDKAGFLEYSLNQMYIVGSFHKSLDNTRYHYLGGGVQLGMNQRNLNYSKIAFQDQFNGIDAYSLPTLELLPENNFAHSDLSVGISYINMPPKQIGFSAGLALHHILGPENSLFIRDSREQLNVRGESYALPMRITAHFSSTIPLGDLLQIQPRGKVFSQASTILFNVGALAKFSFPKAEKSFFYLGAYYRGSNGLNTFRADLPGMIVGFGYDNLFIGTSYDVSLNSISTFGRSRGSFELSISYFGVYDNQDDMCPKF